MRLKSELWVHAYIRRVQKELVPAQVVRHGDDDAGSIYIKIARLDGTAALYGPAPAGYASADGERVWSEHLAAGTPEPRVDEHVARQREFDPDIWLVEIEDRQGRHFLDGWLSATRG